VDVSEYHADRWHSLPPSLFRMSSVAILIPKPEPETVTSVEPVEGRLVAVAMLREGTASDSAWVKLATVRCTVMTKLRLVPVRKATLQVTDVPATQVVAPHVVRRTTATEDRPTVPIPAPVTVTLVVPVAARLLGPTTESSARSALSACDKLPTCRWLVTTRSRVPCVPPPWRQ